MFATEALEIQACIVMALWGLVWMGAQVLLWITEKDDWKKED